jgi:type IV pilus biogenesis protein CpaD/CtpE
MVLLAALRMSGSEGKDVPTALLPGCAQQIRVAMQTVRINGKDADPIYMEANRADRDNEIDKLIARVDARLSRMNAAKYGMLVRALNVFEHKLARMNALAYTGNFWKPVEID